ncbi:MAG: SpoIIE family protein phosphatase [Chlamydiia bacterium]|nr:SpoIIE family protein phosphatase [Chlamydiia bacterium]
MIPFRKSLAFRLLAISFILLALPLLVDSFVIVQKSYRNAISDAKGRLVELAKTREMPLSQIQPIKRPLLVLIEYAFNLREAFPQQSDPKTQEKLLEMKNKGGFAGISFIKITSNKEFIVVDSSNPFLIGRNDTNLIMLSNIFSPEARQRGYFTYISYEYRTPQPVPVLIVGRVVYSKEKESKPLGVIIVSQEITQKLDKFLQPDTDLYAVNFAFLLPDTVIFASSDPSLQYQYFEPMSETHRDRLISEAPFAEFLLPKSNLKVSYKIGYPFFEFTWNRKRQIGYIHKIATTDYSLLVYSAKNAIYAAPLHEFVAIYGSYAAILIIGGLIAYMMTRLMARPLKKLSSTMIEIQRGNLSSRYRYDQWGFEINLLGDIFNDMVDALLAERAVAEKERIKKETLSKELLIGQEVQRNLLPQLFHEFPGLDIDIGEIYIPAKDVGGDFYGVHYEKEKSKIYFTIADASGKGVQACFYSVGVRSLLRAFYHEYEKVEDVMLATNNLFCKDTSDSGMFVTMLVGIFDLKTKTLSYSSFGHNPGIIRRKNGQIQDMKNQNMAMGVEFLDSAISDTVTLEGGDVVLFYTDGITEAHNQQFVQFSEERLREILKEEGDHTASVIARRIVAHVHAFAGGAPQHDDITLLVIKVL